MAAIIKDTARKTAPRNREAPAEQTLANMKGIWRETSAQAPRRTELLSKAFSLSLAKALVASDYEVLKQLSRSEIRSAFARLEGKIRGGSATDELETLCAAKCNCDREVLLWLLHWFSNEPIFPILKNWLYKPGVGSIGKFFGITSKQLKKLVTRIDDVASRVERVNRQF